VGSGYTDTLGNVTIDVGSLPAPADSMYITVTGYNKVPYIGSIPINPPYVEETEGNGLALRTALTSLYPNPFHDKLTIKYQIGQGVASGQESAVSLKIYDAAGQLVKSFLLPTSNFSLSTSIVWDGYDDRGRLVPGGVYFVHFTVSDYKKIEKAIFLR
jgi:hypothetical protein